MPRKKKTDARPDASQMQPPGSTDDPLPIDEFVQSPDAQNRKDVGFPIVGIGASAGGLMAFEKFFSGMPQDTESGMAFVVVQHLSPDHKSVLADLVKRYTPMHVYEVEDGMRVKPNCTYIIPPNRDMAILNGRLQLLELTAPRGIRMPIDFFFRSLAQDQHEQAICVVLSGSGSDGTLGLRVVKGEGGLAIVQDPETTQYTGMPASAIATGLADAVLAPEAILPRLIAYVTHVSGKKATTSVPAIPRLEDKLQKIFVLLRTQTGHDFSRYKLSTLIRRIERRMALLQVEQLDDYIRYLQTDGREAQSLFRDLLIGVTNFFRDREAFEALEIQVIPRLFANKPPGSDVRVWVCGCSTGEEAYSIGILIQEHLDNLKQPFRVQIFATDIDKQSIDQARSGIFPASIAADISPGRLARFFTLDAESGQYRIHKGIRDLMVFSEQDVIKDPPFSKLDLISCRNLLIYMNSDLQRKLIPVFHYALNLGGILFLGASETLGEFNIIFSPLVRKWKIFTRRDEPTGPNRLAFSELVASSAEGHRPRERAGERRDETSTSLAEITQRALLAHHDSVGVLVSGRGEILYIHGRTGKFLEPAPGEAGMNILAMARTGLQRELTAAFHRAVAGRQLVSHKNLRVQTNGESVTINLAVRPAAPVGGEGNAQDAYLVVLEEVPAPMEAPASTTDKALTPSTVDGRIAALESELRSKEEYLQTTIEEMETSNEELKSTNEELQSVNEELQSTNEELETSKEELQSVNEELATVNAELQTKVVELSRANNDMNNLLAGTGVATLFVDMNLRITRFTPAATQIINLIPGDIGRPLAHTVSNLVDYDRLVEDIRKVLDTLIPYETEVQIQSDETYLMRIRPYRTLENVIEGVVITFTDITEVKRTEEALRESDKKAHTFFEKAPFAISLLRWPDGTLVDVNQAFEGAFGYTKEEAIGKTLLELGIHRVAMVQKRMLDGLKKNRAVQDQEMVLYTKSGEKRIHSVNIDLVDIGSQTYIINMSYDITRGKTGNS
ncbi:MAG TPA: chemotaxis protein CheB [Anaerolineales bacterium]|nr:chemotaxis protein CheB [Anaerolineales bacterium]